MNRGQRGGVWHSDLSRIHQRSNRDLSHVWCGMVWPACLFKVMATSWKCSKRAGVACIAGAVYCVVHHGRTRNQTPLGCKRQRDHKIVHLCEIGRLWSIPHAAWHLPLSWSVPLIVTTRTIGVRLRLRTEIGFFQRTAVAVCSVLCCLFDPAVIGFLYSQLCVFLSCFNRDLFAIFLKLSNRRTVSHEFLLALSLFGQCCEI